MIESKLRSNTNTKKLKSDSVKNVLGNATSLVRTVGDAVRARRRGRCKSNSMASVGGSDSPIEVRRKSGEVGGCPSFQP